MKRPRIRMMRPAVAIMDLRTARPPLREAKRADRELGTADHRAWRVAVKERAGYRCEWIEDGVRCEASQANGNAVLADHIVERQDGGALFDPSNGRCLCYPHHGVKTARERERRLRDRRST
jgi:5-methylcytosine-specific restriction enzyme A